MERSPLCRHGEIREECGQCRPWREASQRRKANGIRLGRWTVMMSKDALVSVNEFWSGWVEELGKEKATDYLLVAMRKADEALRRALERRGEQKKRQCSDS